MKRGFTLVELLVVLVIIGILVALILPNTLRAIRQGNTRACASNIRTINTAIQMCYSETRDWSQCNTLQLLQDYFPDVSGNGVGDIPVCPFPNAPAYTIVQDQVTGGFRASLVGHFDQGHWPDRHNP